MIEMKLKISIDERDFREKLLESKAMLEESLSKGVLDEKFYSNMEELKTMEELMLKDLVPYYRSYGREENHLSMRISKITNIGQFSFETFADKILRLSSKLYLVAGLDGGLRFFYLDLTKDKVEWTGRVKDINTRFSNLFILGDEILLLGMNRESYLISLENRNSIPNLDRDLKIKKILNDEMNGFDKSILINKTSILVARGEGQFDLVNLKGKSGSYYFENTGLKLQVGTWSAIKKLGENYFVIGDRMGHLILIKLIDNKFKVDRSIKVMEGPILNIGYLESESLLKDNLIATGTNGQVSILNLSDFSLDQVEALEGNIIETRSKEGSIVLLSDNGLLYGFEENFSIWNYGENLVEEEIYFTNISNFEKNIYLGLGLDGSLYRIDLIRINSPDDLRKISIYS